MVGLAAGSWIVTCARLAEYKVIWAEKLAERPSADAVHGAGLQVHQHGAWDVAPSSRFVEVRADALQLEVGIAVIRSSRVDSVFTLLDRLTGTKPQPKGTRKARINPISTHHRRQTTQ